MEGLLYAPSANAPWTFLALTVLLGGATGWATGRILAMTWRQLWQIVPYALALAAVVGFLHYVLFHENTVPLDTIIAAIGARDATALATALRYYAVICLVIFLFAAAGYAVTRARQMRRQYGFQADPTK
ncbi:MULTISPECIES: DUF6867 family protein [unclassified Beijerinckia]|uniref:DUF6867 family protein n=1 Tax=unclassified Beijerinckia TaxID=2638183 RepID=UPI00089A3816|nr:MULTISPECIES: hypothetical protein [unclassified Beijerinckia]MDH7799822.1 hypothetical protein [Beijerinckia sp. GAS462]SED38745.1 hypothetical protein SAMN05443249_5239 [Beijerinckia sp. 28-YEA-48]